MSPFKRVFKKFHQIKVSLKYIFKKNYHPPKLKQEIFLFVKCFLINKELIIIYLFMFDPINKSLYMFIKNNILFHNFINSDINLTNIYILYSIIKSKKQIKMRNFNISSGDNYHVYKWKVQMLLADDISLFKHKNQVQIHNQFIVASIYEKLLLMMVLFGHVIFNPIIHQFNQFIFEMNFNDQNIFKHPRWEYFKLNQIHATTTILNQTNFKKLALNNQRQYCFIFYIIIRFQIFMHNLLISIHFQVRYINQLLINIIVQMPPYIIQIYNLKHIKSQPIQNMQQHKNTYQHPQLTSNLIMISHINLQPIQSQVSCKICLEKGGEMISPCLCKGSLQYVHENCIKQWLKHRLENKNQFGDNRGYGYKKCEICQQQIGFNYVTTRYCGCHTFFQRIKSKKSLFTYIFFVLMTAIGRFLYLLIKSIMESNLPMIAIVIVVILQILLLMGFLFMMTNCIFKYFISREILIIRILSKNKMVNGQ